MIVVGYTFINDYIYVTEKNYNPIGYSYRFFTFIFLHVVWILISGYFVKSKQEKYNYQVLNILSLCLVVIVIILLHIYIFNNWIEAFKTKSLNV